MAPFGEVRLRLDGEEIVLQTRKGLFSYGHIDPGTRVLLEILPPPPVRGDLLDLGCGYGPITVALARRHPDRTVWAVDTNPEALALARANAARLGLRNVVAAPPDEAAGGRFAAIYSNPPVRVGKGAMRELLLRWLAHLEIGGCAYLVVKKNLGADSLAEFITAEGYPTVRLRSRRGYRVLESRGHDPPSTQMGVATGCGWGCRHPHQCTLRARGRRTAARATCGCTPTHRHAHSGHTESRTHPLTRAARG